MKNENPFIFNVDATGYLPSAIIEKYITEAISQIQKAYNEKLAEYVLNNTLCNHQLNEELVCTSCGKHYDFIRKEFRYLVENFNKKFKVRFESESFKQ